MMLFSKSLFGQVALSFFISIGLITLTALMILKALEQEGPQHNLSRPLLTHIITELNIPPSTEKLRTLSQRLQGDITVMYHGEVYWQSNPILPRPESTPGNDFAITRYATQKTVFLRHAGYEFYIVGMLKELSTHAYLVVLLGLGILICVLYANYRFIRWLFYPVKKLHQDTRHIIGGNFHHRIHSTRKDELGELTRSVNTMTIHLHTNLRHKQELFFAISHELRTPLTHAKMYLALMPENNYQKKLDQQLNQLNQLIDTLLESESLDHESLALSMSRFDLRRSLQELQRHDQRRICLQLPNTPCLIQADQLRIKLLFSNLINNALRYTEQHIDVALNLQQSTWQCIITDYGEGIPENELPYLTEAFYRPDKSRHRKTGSHGLGLYLCQKIADAHHGTLQIHSTQGQGTIVTVTLPIYRP